ncbi:DUF2235 domain-containing protein [Luteibacter aegosomatis]|uniref:T6SS phospholipase effector Tle1-like catalytic domain-containing protein n=1 Tax=Luteibacter aegosomatis TaxID=2911537 RepID=UPI001FF86914|nr:DUF2235 domain-containing protein [Luteibacter aegosomatis]UPG85729.1 DUF2235 domain-containing protein [Luteibacter aegosomatis]
MEKHKKDGQGRLTDGVDSHPISNADREAYDEVAKQLSSLNTPKFLTREDRNQRLFIADFDGTGNDIDGDPMHGTNVGLIYDQFRRGLKDPRVAARYVPGPGTQNNYLVKTADGAIGFTYDARLEEMYDLLVKQAYKWKIENPESTIRVISVGFSRGAEEAAGFSRLLHERGIQDPSGVEIERRAYGPDVWYYTKRPYVDPGQIVQAIGLFDPVGTGRPHERDRRLPPSVMSGFAIYARDERRNDFPATLIIEPGLSKDGRFLGVWSPGAHSDIGGSYHIDGLAILNGNLMIDYINSFSEDKLLERRPEPKDPLWYAIHDSQQHMRLLYRVSEFEKNGERTFVGAQPSAPDCRRVVYCEPPEPFDERLRPLVGSLYPVKVDMTPIPELTPQMVLELEQGQIPAFVRHLSRNVEAISPENERLIPEGETPRLEQVINQQAASTDAPHKEVGMDMVQEEIITSQKSLAEVMNILAEKDPSRSTRIDVRAFDVSGTSPVQSPPVEVGVKAPAAITEPQGNVNPGITGADERAAARLREEREAMAFIESLRREQRLEAASSKPQAQAEAYSRNDPRNERHPDHRMFQSIYLQLGELNAQSNINASKGEMERITSALMVEAKRNHMGSVTHMHYGKDKNGGFMPIIHLKEAFHGDLDDPRTRWAAVDGTKAVNQPIEQSLQQLDDVNQTIQQRQLMREAELSQQQGIGMSMSR